MGFSKAKFTPSIEVKFDFPKCHGGGRGELSIATATTLEAFAFRLAFQGLEETERTREKTDETVRRFICAQLDKEPVGFDDFPVDERPRSERADEYFSNNEPSLQEFFNGIFWTAWLAHKEATEPDTFPPYVSDSSTPESGNTEESEEPASGL